MENEFLDRAQLDELEAAQKEKERKARIKAEKKAEKKNKSVKAAQARKPSAFVQILNGDFLTKEFITNNLTFIFFVFFLLLLLVGKGYYGKELTKKVNATQLELNEVNSDLVEAQARREEETQRLKLVEELGENGLKETENPTKVIRIKKKK